MLTPSDLGMSGWTPQQMNAYAARANTPATPISTMRPFAPNQMVGSTYNPPSSPDSTMSSSNPIQSPSSQMMSQPSASTSYAHGGAVPMRHSMRSPRNMIPVHIAPHEIEDLMHAQGEQRFAYNHGHHPMFDVLDQHLSNPHMKMSIIEAAKRHFAEGGHLSHLPEHMRPRHEHITGSHGRHGDTRIAYIGPHLKHILEAANGGPLPRNPHDGAHECFNFGSLFSGLASGLGGIGKTIFNGAKSILPGIVQTAAPIARSLIPAAQGALASRFGAPGAIAGQIGGSILDNLLPSGPQTQAQQGMTNLVNQGMNNYQNYTQQGGQVNNVSDLYNALGGGNMLQQGSKVAAQASLPYLQQQSQTSQNPLMQMGYDVANGYANS